MEVMDILKRGDNGTEVANWQRILKSFGYSVEADGDFGTRTEQATKLFQATHGLRDDGIVGDATRKAALDKKPEAVGSVKQEVELGHSPINTAVRSAQKLADVHPVLRKKALALLIAAENDGYTLTVTQGLRTFEEQDKLFAKRPKVTNARGGQSYHCYGLAVDFAFVVDGKISWDDALYSKIGKWADAVGLEWGGGWKTFKDRPHVQLKGLPSYKVLLPIYQAGGLKAVWAKYGNEA